MDCISNGLSLDDISALFEDLVVTITDTTKLEDGNNHHPYISYSVHMFSPQVAWTVQKRYNDFLQLHDIITHMELEDMPKAFISLLNFHFPSKHFRISRQVVNERKEAFVKYIEKALQVRDLRTTMSAFLHVKEHVSQRDVKCVLIDGNDSTDDEEAEPQMLSRQLMSQSKSQVFAYKNSYKSSNSFRRVFKPYRLQREREISGASSILSTASGSLLYSYLPATAHNESFKLAYATHRDGWSLSTLYDKIDRRGPCIVLVKELSQGEVVGAYVNCPLGPPSMEMKGDGTCFVFRLDGPMQKTTNDDVNYDDKKYPSAISLRANTQHSQAAHDRSSNAYFADSVDSIREESTLLQFAVASSQYLLFGGSSQSGSNAIRLGVDLVYCSTGPSDTYDSPKLTGSGVRDPFPVADIEIFCGSAY